MHAIMARASPEVEGRSGRQEQEILAGRPQPENRNLWSSKGYRSRLIPTILVALGCLSLGACAALRPFNNQLAAGYQAVNTARQEALTLLRDGTITRPEAQAVQDKADQIRGGLDLARSVHATDPGRASGVLSRALSAVAQVQRCTSVDRPRLSDCINEVEVPR